MLGPELTDSFTRDTGMRLHDIKFQGERIIYSLGLEEAIAQYAGNDPVQSGTAYLGLSSLSQDSSSKTDVQIHITVSARIASIKCQDTTSHYRVTACRPHGMRMNYLK